MELPQSKTVTNLKFVDEHPHPYLPLTGGTITGNLTVSGSDGKSGKITTRQLSIEYAEINVAGTSGTGIFIAANDAETMLTIRTDGLQFYANKNKVIPTWTFTGISDTKGTSSTLAASLKCLNDNYLPLSGGTLTGALTATKFTGDGSGLTSIPAGQLTGMISSDRLPDLSSKYLPLTGGELSGSLGVRGEDGVSADRFVGGVFMGTGCSLHPATSAEIVIDIEPHGEGENTYLAISTNSFTHYSDFENSVVDWTFTGISDAKGTSSTIAASLKCLNDNYISKVGGTISGTYSETGKTGSTYLGPGFVEVFSEGTGQITVYNKDSNGMTVDKSDLTPSGLGINGDGGSIAASFSKNGFWVSYGGGTNHVSVTAQNIAIGRADSSSDLTITAGGINFPELTSQLTGITYDKGTSKTLAMSQKGVADNYLALSGGTLSGQLTLSSNGIKFNTNAIKDITYSTTDLTAGASTLATNSIYIVYE